ncbi:AIR carboxylase family protein [Treponema sp. OMZ 788]|uniref:phosphoribosylaminoimidazole carboxylase n=1 Tax=Treponema sp. OMZ 788 TaxID=2563664 RepID=UPI0020A55D7A|nr:AIR carboxylase family protein [Treponema sp. OMZ 788]UTC64780.1 AIR carboxylase family protein [Treponema sp. OMZ 788]
MKPLVIILMGSSSDMGHAEKIASELKIFGIEYAIRIGSAHKTAEHVVSMLKEYEALDRPKLYITIAGRSNALSGFVDGFVKSATIACPPPSDSFAGADIYSSLRMPSGISPALVLEPKNAALLAARIFSLYDKEIAGAVKSYMESNAQRIIEDDSKLKK